jgi:hypothetical protein
MDDALFSLLKQVDTPTVCNAIEVAQGKRGFNDFTRGTLLPRLWWDMRAPRKSRP